MRKILLIFLFAFTRVTAFSQTENAGINPVISKLKTLSTDRVTEKAYLHFDKPYYAAGDTIYFKAYVTLGERHEPSKLSGILHVDLINTNNKIDQSLKLQLNNGIAWGDFALPDSLPMGNYRVRAYTQWMRNVGQEQFFDQTILVGSLKTTSVKTQKAALNISSTKTPAPEISLQFFPEGGELLTCVSSKIAFKAIGINGFGVNAKGVITDSDNHEICRFETAHLGMGYFYLEPQDGKTYKAKITFANGTQNITELPVTNPKGITLSVNNDSLGKATVQILANSAYYQENQNKAYSLLIYSGGVATTVKIQLDSTVIRLDIQKRHLYSGVTQITLFSPEAEPLCERLIFIQNPDLLKLAVTSDKPNYKTREHTRVSLNAKNKFSNPVTGNFSVSVIDESKVPVDENMETTILTNLLLTSDLKGNIEQPNYYFVNTTDKTRADVDVLMLTQGYRKFSWKEVLNETAAVKYQPERTLEIAGKVKTLSGKLIANGNVSLLSPMGGPILSQSSDKDGEFHFSNLVFMDTTSFILQATNAKGRNSTEISYHKDPTAPSVIKSLSRSSPDIDMATYLDNNKKQQDNIAKFGSVKGIMLNEVKIKEVKRKDHNYRTQSLAGAGNADQVVHVRDLHGGQLSDVLNGRLRGVTFIGAFQKVPYLTLSFMSAMGSSAAPPMLVVMDGAILNTGTGGVNIDNININDVETVEVLKGASASIYGMNAAGGVLVITTKQGGGRDAADEVALGILPIKAFGFYKAREFYAPKYDINPQNPRADLRTTIFWKPDVVTDKDGNASFEYYNADGQGTYRVVVEGIDDKGNIGRQVYRYQVE
jgi:TonB-dependent SusC/RagA subfamily outer membrane receptor